MSRKWPLSVIIVSAQSDDFKKYNYREYSILATDPGFLYVKYCPIPRYLPEIKCSEFKFVYSSIGWGL